MLHSDFTLEGLLRLRDTYFWLEVTLHVILLNIMMLYSNSMDNFGMTILLRIGFLKLHQLYLR